MRRKDVGRPKRAFWVILGLKRAFILQKIEKNRKKVQRVFDVVLLIAEELSALFAF